MNISKDYHNNNIILNNEYEHNQIEHYNNINNINKKDMVGGINYMYPQTKTGYDHYYDINQHMMLDHQNKINNVDNNSDKNNKIDDDVSDNKIKNLVDEITNNIDNMENIYEKYEPNEEKNENVNKKNKKKNKNNANNDNNDNEKNNYDIYFEKWKDSIIIFVIYIILSLPSIQTFIGKYIKHINPDPITCTVSMYGVVIYGIILSIMYFIVKNKIVCS